jgi:hypothetical protein
MMGEAVGDAVGGILAHGGPVALLLAVVWAGKYAIEGFVSWRRSRRQDGGAVMTDAATTNAMLLDALRVERSDNRSKDQRIDELEREVDDLRDQLWQQRREYEHEVAELRSKIQDVTLQLEALQTRIRAGLDEPTR